MKIITSSDDLAGVNIRFWAKLLDMNATLNLCLLDRNSIKQVGVVGVTNLFGMAAHTLRFSFEVKALTEMEIHSALKVSIFTNVKYSSINQIVYTYGADNQLISLPFKTRYTLQH